MTRQVEATFAHGVLMPDSPLLLAEQARVRLTIEPIEEWSPASAREAWERFKTLADEHPIHCGGVKFSRDELHERR